MSLHALVEKWREQAGIIELNSLEACSIGLHAAANISGSKARLLTECADELAAALAAGDGAVAWVDRYDLDDVISGRRMYTHLFTTKTYGYDIPLFLNPAAAGQVDEAMVDRAFSVWKQNVITGDLTNKACLRAALTAALNPGGSREY